MANLIREKILLKLNKALNDILERQISKMGLLIWKNHGLVLHPLVLSLYDFGLKLEHLFNDIRRPHRAVVVDEELQQDFRRNHNFLKHQQSVGLVTVTAVSTFQELEVNTLNHQLNLHFQVISAILDKL